VNNITTGNDGDVVRRVATNIFFKLIMLDFFRLLCVGNEMSVKGETCLKKEKENTSVSSYHPLVSIQRRLNNE